MLKILDVEGAVRRERQPLAAGPRRELELRRRALRPGHGPAACRADGDGGVRHRWPLPDARACRSSSTILTRAIAVAARSVRRRASRGRRTRRWSSWPDATCVPSRLSSRPRRWHRTQPARCARSPRMPVSTLAGRWRASATVAGGRRWRAACAKEPSSRKLLSGWPTSCVAPAYPVGVGHDGPVGAARRRDRRAGPSGSPPSWESRTCSSSRAGRTARRSARWRTPCSRPPTSGAPSP